VEASSNEAFELLRKWSDEKRIIQCGLFDGAGCNCGIIGRIDEIVEESVLISAKSMYPRGKFISLAVNLHGARFRFEDWRDAPPQDTEPLRAAYDSFLFITLARGWHCEIYATKLSVEME
jgi:EAL domain-containing protein (putative c-di-GMP-specific phosphodiesterase class I)